MTSHCLSPGQLSRIVLLAVDGWTQRAIAGDVGCSQGQVARVLAKVEGIQRRRRAAAPCACSGHVAQCAQPGCTGAYLLRDPTVSAAAEALVMAVARLLAMQKV